MLWLNIIIKCRVYTKSGQFAYVGNSLVEYIIKVFYSLYKSYRVNRFL